VQAKRAYPIRVHSRLVSLPSTVPVAAHLLTFTLASLLRYFTRCQIFTSFYLFFVFLGAGLVNSYIWTGQKHFLTGVSVVTVGCCNVGIWFCVASYTAARLQSLAGDDRLMLRRDRFLIDKEIIDVEQEANAARGIKKHWGVQEAELSEYIQLLKNSKSFLKSGEELIQLEEEELQPVEVLGMKAEMGILTSIGGLFLTICFFAYEGYNNSNMSYQGGWFLSNGDGDE